MTDSAAALDHWLAHISGVHPLGMDMGLERVAAVGERLGLTRPANTTVLVAGTNGKGSACEYLARFAMASGLTVGKSTSPHLHRFNERIEIGGEPLADAPICRAFAEIERARGDVTLTYFEFASLASMYLFRRSEVDVAILEVGLGGRLDAMNIVEPDLCIITAIALDHQDWLGDTREAIGREKAGIMRRGVKCIVADRDPPRSIPAHAARIGAALDLIGVDFDAPARPGLKLPQDSYAAARHAAACLGWDLSREGEAAAASLPGRRTWLAGEPCWLLDVAHNPAAAADFAGYLGSLDRPGDVHALLGMYRDKDITGVTAALAPLVKTWHLTDMEDPRAETGANLAARMADRHHGKPLTYANIGAAIAGVKTLARRDDLIIVFGSFPVVAGALQQLENTSP